MSDPTAPIGPNDPRYNSIRRFDSRVSDPPTAEKIDRVVRDIWAMVDPMPNTILVAPSTVERVEAVIAFDESLCWWRRAFYWVFRAKGQRDLRRFVAARVPEDARQLHSPSGLDAFIRGSDR